MVYLLGLVVVAVAFLELGIWAGRRKEAMDRACREMVETRERVLAERHYDAAPMGVASLASTLSFSKTEYRG